MEISETSVVMAKKGLPPPTVVACQKISFQKYQKTRLQIQGSQQQEVKFQDPMFTKFQDNFRTFLSISRGSRHRKCTFFCPHKGYSLKQISIAVLTRNLS